VTILEFTTPFKLESLNAFTGMHWRLKNSHKKAWLQEIRMAMAKAGIKRPAPLEAGTAKLRIVRVLGPHERLWDEENLSGGSAKQLVDALVTLGFLRDDAPKWLRREYAQDANDRDHPGTRVILERVSPGTGDVRVLLEALETYAASANGAIAVRALTRFRGAS
jgi:hypothetical protein